MEQTRYSTERPIGGEIAMVDNSDLRVKVIVGSTRKKRYADKPAQWIADEAGKRAGVKVEILDLRDFPMPFYNEEVSALRLNGNYSSEMVTRWSEKIVDGDAFIITAAEYNRGYTAVLKNALDAVFPEWNDKAVGFIGYGSVGGARAIEQLRQVVVELKMVPIRLSLHIPSEIFLATQKEKAPLNPEIFRSLREGMFGDRVGNFLAELIATGNMLKMQRKT
jgi:NAD(P)H-dependent FMN reductase